jgi:dienelactone hydrolase
MTKERLASLAAALGLALACLAAAAGETVQFPKSGGDGDNAEAILSLAAGQNAGTKSPAVILLHSAWGWADAHEGVGTYAAALSRSGFAVLELHMFANAGAIKPGGPTAYLPELFGALKYLASRQEVDPRRIAVAGYSFGGVMALTAATTWAAGKYGGDSLRFAAHAPFYPICWVLKANAKGRKSPVPADAWLQWTGAPVRIYAGALDDYDDRDANACQDAVDSLPEAQRKAFSVRVFPEATHGWDQPRDARFFEKLGCKGRGCSNTNTPNPEATRQSVEDLISFLSKAMP